MLFIGIPNSSAIFLSICFNSDPPPVSHAPSLSISETKAGGVCERDILIASIISFSAYAIIIWSMKHIPIGFVASMRESSIVFASLIGYLFLKERIGYIRLFSGFIFFIGIYLIYNS